MFNARTKHVELDFHFIRERVVSQQLKIQFLSSKDQIGDILTKGLSTRFLLLCDKLTVTFAPISLRGDC